MKRYAKGELLKACLEIDPGVSSKQIRTLYSRWVDIRRRCFNPNNDHYHNYGGRGITICQEWLDDFINFFRWSFSTNGEYNFKLSIDRINVNGNYEPSNCRWSTQKEQCNNTRNTRYVVVNGVRQPLTYASERYSVVSRHTADERIRRYGWSEEDAILKPKNEILVDINGLVETRNKTIRRLGIAPKSTTIKRINHLGWSTAESLFTPGPMVRVTIERLSKRLKRDRVRIIIYGDTLE